MWVVPQQPYLWFSMAVISGKLHRLGPRVGRLADMVRIGIVWCSPAQTYSLAAARCYNDLISLVRFYFKHYFDLVGIALSGVIMWPRWKWIPKVDFLPACAFKVPSGISSLEGLAASLSLDTSSTKIHETCFESCKVEVEWTLYTNHCEVCDCNYKKTMDDCTGS